MSSLLVKNLANQVEALTDFNVTKKDEIENGRSIDVTVWETDRNAHSFPLIQNEGSLFYEDEEFVIRKTRYVPISGKRLKVDITALQRSFSDLGENYVYETSGKKKKLYIEDMLDIALKGSGYSYEVLPEGLGDSFEVEDFGNGYSLGLLSDIKEKYSAEYECIGKKVYFAKEIARDTDYIIRDRVNVKDPSQEIDTSSIKTYIKGFGKKDEKTGKYAVEAEYTSPLASVYGIKHANPIFDDSYTAKDEGKLEKRLEKELTDKIEISISLTYIEVKQLNMQDIRKGDYVWCVLEPFDLKTKLRVVSVESYSDPKKSPVFTFGKVRANIKKTTAKLGRGQSSVSKLIDTSTGKVKGSAISGNITIGKDAIYEDGYDPTKLTIPTYGRANATTDGLMSSSDYVKLASILLGPDGQVSVSLATETTDGLMSASDFTKLKRIKVGAATVDISTLTQQLESINKRLTALENK
ncbi:phage tail protein [Bacillus velezensis]|uniref:phage tail protein n=1 Tax=Bacillus velezensis TaxID=492670 RepID=UPI001469CE97|nr:phage tail protein [Bacillus velezensis]NMW10758.1 phage tail protein [Bacillus velezensis]